MSRESHTHILQMKIIVTCSNVCEEECVFFLNCACISRVLCELLNNLKLSSSSEMKTLNRRYQFELQGQSHTSEDLPDGFKLVSNIYLIDCSNTVYVLNTKSTKAKFRLNFKVSLESPSVFSVTPKCLRIALSYKTYVSLLK